MVCDELPLGEKSSVVDAACPPVKGERRLEQEHKCNDGAPYDREGFDRLRGEWQDQIFLPEGKKADVVVQETRDFLQRIYDGSVGMMMSALVRQNDLSQEDILELPGDFKGSADKDAEDKEERIKARE